MRLLVGLGNPGPRYQGTRHNLGFEAVGLLARRHGIELGRKKFSSRFGRGRMAGRDVLLAQPQTYMNLSGGAVSQIAAYFGLGLEDVLVLHDDLDVELGRIKVAARGGAGGHKGVASIINSLGGPEFARIKIGVGRPPPQWSGEDFVLGRFASEELELVERALVSAAEAAEKFVADGVAEAQALYNRRDLNI